jgi:hypothetical protein
MYEVDFMHYQTFPEAFCSMAHMWEDRVVSRRARMHFHGEVFIMNEVLGVFLESYVSELGQALPPFDFQATSAVEWKLKTDIFLDILAEREKGAKLALLASGARSMMAENAKDRFTVKGVDQRAWGRLVLYTQACLGQSFYKTERDRKRGGARPRGKKPKPEEPPTEEVEVSRGPSPAPSPAPSAGASPTSPRYTPSPRAETSVGVSPARVTRSRSRAAASVQESAPEAAASRQVQQFQYMHSHMNTHLHTHMRQHVSTHILTHVHLVQGNASSS